MLRKDKMLNARQVARMLECSEEDVVILALRGKIPFQGKGKFRHLDVLAYKSRKAEAA